MNKLIKKELNNLKVAKLDSYSEENHTYTFKKINNISLDIDSYYLIKIDDMFFSGSSAISIFNTNFNANNLPKRKYLKALIISRVGDVVKVDGVEYDFENKLDTSDLWIGWLPIDMITIINRL